MNLSTLLLSRASKGRAVRAALIGAGKFGSMILSQIPRIEGLHMVAVVDLDVAQAREAFRRVGWADGTYGARSVGEAIKSGATFVTDDVSAMLACPEIECVIEATGHPLAGTRHALACIEHGKHVVMVNVEADVMVGPILAEKARAKGLIYSMAYGDQPALICELVDWARACGFEITAAGKGMNFEPRYRYSTPDTVWGLFGWSEEMVKKDKLNPRLYNSFTDGTKAAIEMAAVANGTGLDCPDDGLAFPPAGVHDLAKVFRPTADGGRMARSGLVEIAASQEPDGREVFNNVRYGVFVTFKAHSEYVRSCFKQYGLLTDPSGWYASLWPLSTSSVWRRPSASSRRRCGTRRPDLQRISEGTLSPPPRRTCSRANCLDGEGGFAVWAKAIQPRAASNWERCRWGWPTTFGLSGR